MDTGQLPHPLMYGMPIAGTDAAGFNPRRGTLTGLAIRTSDGQKVLATNIHVIADLGPFDGTPQPLGFEEMYQEDHLLGQSRKVGELTGSEYEYSPVLDIGVCDLEAEVEAPYQVHDSRHDLGMVVRGTKEPEFGMKLVVVGRTGGVGTVSVLEVNDEDELLVPTGLLTGEIETVTGRVLLDVSNRPLTGRGDSGAPCLFEELPGVYRLVAILYGGDPDARPPEGYAFPASRVESALGINFGYERRPVERRTGIPILTSEGFEGHRLLVRNYFVAGEPLGVYPIFNDGNAYR